MTIKDANSKTNSKELSSTNSIITDKVSKSSYSGNAANGTGGNNAIIRPNNNTK